MYVYKLRVCYNNNYKSMPTNVTSLIILHVYSPNQLYVWFLTVQISECDHITLWISASRCRLVAQGPAMIAPTCRLGCSY